MRGTLLVIEECGHKGSRKKFGFEKFCGRHWRRADGDGSRS
jgi:hypothetical protein